MILRELNILNYKNITEARLTFSEKVNCFVGLNGQGKTNLLDAIYLLSFTKSAFTTQDSACIRHGEQIAMVKGIYSNSSAVYAPTAERSNSDSGLLAVSCGLKAGVKKQFRIGKKDEKRLIDHIGRIPCVMVSPKDGELIADGSDERRRFMDVVISQQDRSYLEHLTRYNALLKQRNALLKQLADSDSPNLSLLEVYDLQMLAPALYIYEARTRFIATFVPLFQQLYNEISGGNETVSLGYISQLQDRELSEAWARTRDRDLILGWTSQGVHKDDLLMQLGEYPLKQVGSQGQQKSYLLAMKLAQALYLTAERSISDSDPCSNRGDAPVLLLDDIFDKLDAERVERIVRIVGSERFGQIFITDTDRQHLTDILHPDESARVFHVENGNCFL